MSGAYRRSGVDVEAGYKAVSLMKKHVEATFSANVLTGLGTFGGLFSIKEAKNMEEPVLCAGVDGVGTKLKIAFLLDKHDTIGIDCVAMCVNDIICMGATPLFFLDYIACGKNIPEKIEKIVEGMANGCNQSGVSLIGGETAEMPGIYDDNEYDIAGFAAGIVDKKKIINGSSIEEGDVIVGIESNGLHSNGYSLVRSVLRPDSNKLSEYVTVLKQKIGDALIMPTKIYVKPVLKLIDDVPVKGIVNITGGGFYENIPRIIPNGLGAKINVGAWNVLPIFDLIQKTGKISDNDMYGTFNMGVGMAAVVSSQNADAAVQSLCASGEKASVIGNIIKGSGVTLC